MLHSVRGFCNLKNVSANLMFWISFLRTLWFLWHELFFDHLFCVAL